MGARELRSPPEQHLLMTDVHENFSHDAIFNSDKLTVFLNATEPGHRLKKHKV